MAIAYLGLGANIGNRRDNLARALKCLASRVQILRLSSVYETDPVGYPEQPLFLNMVCQVSTDIDPPGLLHLAKSIERQLGRQPSFRDAPRVIDIDILFYDGQVLDTEELTIPHPDIADRAFVLAPLDEIAPNLVHPLKGNTVAQLFGRLKPPLGVKKLSDTIEVN